MPKVEVVVPEGTAMQLNGVPVELSHRTNIKLDSANAPLAFPEGYPVGDTKKPDPATPNDQLPRRRAQAFAASLNPEVTTASFKTPNGWVSFDRNSGDSLDFIMGGGDTAFRSFGIDFIVNPYLPKDKAFVYGNIAVPALMPIKAAPPAHPAPDCDADRPWRPFWTMPKNSGVKIDVLAEDGYIYHNAVTTNAFGAWRWENAPSSILRNGTHWRPASGTLEALVLTDVADGLPADLSTVVVYSEDLKTERLARFFRRDSIPWRNHVNPLVEITFPVKYWKKA